MFFEFTTSSVVTATSLNAFSTAVNTAILAGKYPLGPISYNSTGTVYTQVWALPKYPKALPKLAGGAIFHDNAADAVAAVNAQAARRPVSLGATEMVGTDDVILLVGYRHPA
jgi:hypothetical protein